MDWHTKPISSGRLMNFNSTQPMKQKLNTAKNLIDKIIDISDQQFHTKNIQKIRSILKSNNYPNKLITQLIENKTKSKEYINNTTMKNTPDEPKQFYSITYIPRLTENKMLHSTITTENIAFAHKSNQTLRTLFSNTKDKIDKQQQHNVVYEIPCNGREGEKCEQVYIGTTKRSLEIRMTEHKADIKKGLTSTALAQHIKEKRHTANIENVRIVDRENNERRRYTLESLRIQQKITTTMNTKEDKDNTNSIYTLVINKSK